MADLVSLLLEDPRSGAELQALLGISPATLSRQIRSQPEVISWGKARATRYALLRPIRDRRQIALWRVTSQGIAEEAGTLFPVWPQGSCLYVNTQQHGQFYSGLPWFLQDMRPQGFLGRAWGREHAAVLGLTADIREWQEEECLLALALCGADMPGNWLVGETTYQRWLTASATSPIGVAEKSQQYPRLASQALSGEEPGSSAGGEQPKFLCYADVGHCLVKFSTNAENENGQRWRDMLRAEHHALQQMLHAGLPAAQSQLYESRGQVFLEVQRFDRCGERGRLGMVSLEALVAEYAGRPQQWPQALQALRQQKVISQQAVDRGTLQWAFGRLIANSDMHAGNLSFFTASEPLELTPAYDMLPMALAPNSQGHMRNEVELRLETALPRAVWQPASALALSYWQGIEQDERFSAGFRAIARAAQQQLKDMQVMIARMA